MPVLRSVHAADAGKVMHPMQCRGLVESGVAQVLGATLFENVRIDERGEGARGRGEHRGLPAPSAAAVRRCAVHRGPFHGEETRDTIGPPTAESMSASPVNPVAPAFADALRDATGHRFAELPLTPDRMCGSP